jgi:hypothetical protein
LDHPPCADPWVSERLAAGPTISFGLRLKLEMFSISACHWSENKEHMRAHLQETDQLQQQLCASFQEREIYI